ncbi:MAG: ribonuclease J [Patescibacteria group bacterium]|nr:ribonuclease J [Patescibacteria group bacterium]MDD5490986.1 ribonuclease J [Patescibacteria group bacterium]
MYYKYKKQNPSERRMKRRPARPYHYGDGAKKLNDDGKKLNIIILGGNEEVGRNMTVFEYGNDIVILDMGIQFPEEDMPGIDYIIPNISYLKGKEKNVRGVIFSHGHLDHIGAAPILLEQIGNPTIIGRDLTLAMIKHRQEDYKKGSSGRLKTIAVKNFEQKIALGSFRVGFFRVEHSIMDAMGVTIETPAGTVIHPGDWTMEQNPIHGEKITYNYLTKTPKPSILMLESLGATSSRERVPEKIMYENLKKLISGAPGRIIIATFASQVERIKQILEYATQINKKVALDGYSMKANVEIAQKLGYIKIGKGTLINIEQINNYPDNKIIVICTGAQGESHAVLSRIIRGAHKNIKIQKQDTIVFSSSVIPGNERTIQRLKDNLYRLSDHVIHSDIMDVHSSGHSTAADIKEMIREIKPTYFLPVYANHYFLKEAANIAYGLGYNKNNVFVLDDGSVFELKNNKVKIYERKANTDYVFVDGLGIGDISNIVLRDRQVMSESGMLVIIATIEAKTGRLVGNPDIISRGFIYMKENKRLVEETRRKAKKILDDKDPRTAAQSSDLKNKLRNDIGQFLFMKTERRPMILPVIIEV